ncbi:MAG: ATP-binding protein [Bryobacterales bacterium]|nr:ATP-binding protein [Bryobacterales bacterium]
MEAVSYRCLRHVRRPLSSIQVLVGPNASGKTTFLDVIAFLGTLSSSGLQAAFRERSQNPLDLLWNREPGRIEIALEAQIPAALRSRLRKQYSVIRYEVAISVDSATSEPSIQVEKAYFKHAEPEDPEERFALFPDTVAVASAIDRRRIDTQSILSKSPGGNDKYYSEVYKEAGKGWAPSYRLGPGKSTLGNLPADEDKFPVALWLKDLLERGVQKIVLNSQLLRLASPPGQTRGFRPDGSNLPWVIREMKSKQPAAFRSWVDHLRTALPDIRDVDVVVREDDRHAYLVVLYSGGLRAPSWLVSDGTLRLLALTILAYLPSSSDIYLVEEPENGIHPTAVETIFQSLSSVYDGQVLVASHSPVLLGVAQPEQLLCFSKNPDGATAIIRGDRHPALREWKGEVSLGTVFASGILGA